MHVQFPLQFQRAGEFGLTRTAFTKRSRKTFWVGHGFSRAIKFQEMIWALAPEMLYCGLVFKTDKILSLTILREAYY
jgi:hypothetical protein